MPSARTRKRPSGMSSYGLRRSPKNSITRRMLSAQAAASPPVVAPRPPGALLFTRPATKRTGRSLSKE